MTIIDAIAKLDARKHNTYSQEDKVDWLSRLDLMVKNQIIDTHEGAEEFSFSGYDDSTDLHTVLLVPAPFDDIYLRWMEAQIDYCNGETDRYNVSIIMYNTAYEAYSNYYHRTHMPRSYGSRFVF